ncbi:MAG: adenosylmethionine decarboxylase [Rhodospirillales bacterium]
MSKLQAQFVENETATPTSVSDSSENKDYFIVRDGVRYAGTHLIIDVYGAGRLDELDHVEAALRDAVDAAGATLLHIHLHHFTPNGGISGVAVLAESHISIHTWPECGYAALDVFMCGETNPHATVEILREAFAPERIAVEEHMRGRGA